MNAKSQEREITHLFTMESKPVVNAITPLRWAKCSVDLFGSVGDFWFSSLNLRRKMTPSSGRNPTASARLTLCRLACSACRPQSYTFIMRIRRARHHYYSASDHRLMHGVKAVQLIGEYQGCLFHTMPQTSEISDIRTDYWTIWWSLRLLRPQLLDCKDLHEQVARVSCITSTFLVSNDH